MIYLSRMYWCDGTTSTALCIDMVTFLTLLHMPVTVFKGWHTAPLQTDIYTIHAHSCCQQR